jgi:recombination protein RecT
MTTTAMTTTQQKAVSLREELFAHQKQFESAMPKWMTPERLIRVVFTTALKNPKILDCSKESIFSAVMQCAQLGVEPILGRAYLIPYNNNKQINGKWVKVLECQFQVGYQGLIDLARRSGTISDIYGYNVYENDDFDIIFGMNPDIRHRPWYMFPERKDKGPGECLGAYCVWVLKDGSKHPEFMPISEIHKRRDASTAYQSDVKYGKTDSPWTKWPEDMRLKTVIKHSSKMVPASIEFMEAVTSDDDSEVGRMSFGAFLSSGSGPITTNGDALSSLIKGKGLDRERVDQFITAVSDRYGSSQDEVIDGIIDDPDGFMGEYRKWEDATYPKSIKDEIGLLKTKGLTEWEEIHRAEIGSMSQDDKAFFLDKWRRTIGSEYQAQETNAPEDQYADVMQSVE